MTKVLWALDSRRGAARAASLVAVVLVVLGTAASGGPPLRPDPQLTPGATLEVTAADICVSGYTKKVRDVPPIIEILQDGRYLGPENAGDDIEYNDGGLSYIILTRPRMYQIVKNPDFEGHELTLIFRANGLALYAFTFTTCVSPNGED